jgi:hypothetical protein
MRRNLRAAICYWRDTFCGNAGDLKMIKRLKAMLGWADCEINQIYRNRLADRSNRARRR